MLPDGEQITLAKYIPHNFEWKWMNPDEQIVEKRKKNKEFVVRAGEQDLRKVPYFLKDGDIIGYRLESENIDQSDDFQTVEDLEAKERFMIQKEEEKKNESTKQRNNTHKKKKDEVAFKILTDF